MNRLALIVLVALAAGGGYHAVSNTSSAHSHPVDPDVEAVRRLRTIATVSFQYRDRFGEFAPDLEALEDTGYLAAGRARCAEHRLSYRATGEGFVVEARATAPSSSSFRLDQRGRIVSIHSPVAASRSSSPTL
ncbi:MAG: hypothetical protein AAF488_05920 [Planctomycetota bacterium]